MPGRHVTDEMRQAADAACAPSDETLNKGGRPSLYSEALAQEIAETFATTRHGLESLCEQHEHWPSPRSVRRWMREHEGFADMIADARARKAERLLYAAVDDLDAVKDAEGKEQNAKVNARRNLADYKMRLAQLLEPERYGSRAAIDVHHHHSIQHTHRLTEDTIRQLQELSGESIEDAEYSERRALPEPEQGDGEAEG